MNLRSTGTVRDGRTGSASLDDKKKFIKGDRGMHQYTCDGNVCIVRWSDNNVVTCASNFDTVFPLKTVNRHVKGKKDKTAIPQPLMIANYTSGMGGVDLMDRLLSAYRPTIKGKKWWWNLFVNAINLAVVAAWRLHCYTSEPSATISHLEFRREITLGLMKSSTRQRLGGPTAPVVGSVRYDGVQHYMESTSQGRCAWCSKNTTKKCTKCNKRLHALCFELYHTKA